MTENEKRLRFVGILTFSAVLYGALLAYRLLPAQSDLLSDILKLSSIAAIGTALSSYFWWTVVTQKMKSAWGGLVAGTLTAICVIPLPTFLGGFKGSYEADSNIISALNAGLKYSLSTVSTAELIALPLCAAAGYILAK